MNTTKHHSIRDRLRAGTLLLLGATLSLPAIALADQIMLFDGDIIEADPFNQMFTELYGRSVPSGAIVMWSGTIDEIPAGWILCDGTDMTPDLTDRFVVGAGSSYTIAEVGGEEAVTLTVEQMPGHAHSYSGHNHAANPGFLIAGWPAGPGYPDWFGFEAASSSAGGDQAHENRPPYYALAYIMKT